MVGPERDDHGRSLDGKGCTRDDPHPRDGFHTDGRYGWVGVPTSGDGDDENDA